MRRFLLPAAVFLVSVIIVGILALMKRTSEMELKLTADSITVPLTPRPPSLFSNVSVRAIALSNFDSFTATAGRISLAGAGPGRAPASRDNTVINGAPFGRVYFENVVLDHIEAPDRSRAVLTWNKAAPSTIKAVFDGPIVIFLRGGSVMTGYCDFCGGTEPAGAHQERARRLTISAAGALGQEVVARASRAPAVVGFEVTASDQLDAPVMPLRAEDIRFESMREGRPVSDVLTGTIHFPEFKDKIIEIPRGEFVRITPGGDLTLRSIKLSDGIQLSITGKVSHIDTGDLSTMRNRAPSVLEWFDEKHSWSLYLAGVVSLTGILWSVIVALRETKEAGN